MAVGRRVLSTAIGILAALSCRIDDSRLKLVPARGPLILVANHINFLEAPLLYHCLWPRPVTVLAKVETWHNPFLGPLFSLAGAIPLRRGEADVDAMRRALAALAAGYIVGVAPEGTRSGDGRLQVGHPGVVVLALRSGAPLLPVAHYGGETFRRNAARLRRTPVHFAVGEPFFLDAGGARVTRAVRRQMADEIMHRLAALLPERYRGRYGGAAPTSAYLRSPGAAGSTTWKRAQHMASNT